jgi:hypothetical protein
MKVLVVTSDSIDADVLRDTVGADGRPIEDALATFPADRIVVVTHPDDQRAWPEEDLDQVRERFDVPVEYRQVTR